MILGSLKNGQAKVMKIIVWLVYGLSKKQNIEKYRKKYKSICLPIFWVNKTLKEVFFPSLQINISFISKLF